MAARSYAAVHQLQARVDPTSAWGDVDKLVGERALEAASRMVEAYTGRRFWRSQSDETRYYAADSGGVCWVDDLVSVTTLATDTGDRTYATTWTSTDYDLTPHRAANDDRPYTSIEVAPQGRYGFPTALARGVKVVGTFGWPEVPAEISEVVLLEASRIVQQSQSPSGVVASAEIGRMIVLPSLHPTSMVMLAGLRRFRMEAA